MRTNLFKKMCLLFTLFAVLFIFSACAMQRAVQEDPVKGSYYVALATYNDALQSYIAQKPVVSEEMRTEIEPLFFEADRSLTLWGVAVNLGEADAWEKEMAFNQIKTELLRLLFKYKILEIKQ